jgi:hypothetical protein
VKRGGVAKCCLVDSIGPCGQLTFTTLNGKEKKRDEYFVTLRGGGINRGELLHHAILQRFGNYILKI